ncbi:hypothetical protein [Reyranella sp.]|uniref:hypothetical protein n=1 Tax=Reyranella sp. TaxID=1929291 RepID=UPI003D144A3E
MKTTPSERRRKLDPEPAAVAATAAPDRPASASDGRESSSEYPIHEEVGHPIREEVVTELANCLWYLKTRYFKRQWLDEENADPDARTRHALGRLDRAIRALDKVGIRLVDPTGTRYPPGGEAMMTPLQFEPTAGISTDTVSQTARPMVFRGSRLIQRGEVFVSVPLRHEVPPDDGKSRE